MRDSKLADNVYVGESVVDGTIMAAITARLIEHGHAANVPLPDLLAEVGWSEARPPSPDTRVPFPAHWGVWRQIHESGVAGDFGLGFGDGFELSRLGVLGMLMTHSATVEDAMMQQTRFQRLLLDTPFKVTRLEPDKLVVEHPPLAIAMQLPHMIVAGLAYWMRLLRELTGARVDALAVELPHPPLAEPERYRASFGVVPTFDAPRISLEVDRRWWSAPVRAQPTGLETYLETRSRALLRQLPTRGEQLDVVREYIVDELRHCRRPTLGAAAQRVCASTRTLQRKLQAVSMSFDALLDEARRCLSIEYLRDDRLTIGEVAVVLGYSEPATFYRAFKRWTGMPPGAYRASRPA